MDFDKIDNLATQVEKHDKLYWEKNAPIISDGEYDDLVFALGQLDPDHPLVNKINTGSVDRPKIKHDVPMLSLDKVYSTAELVAWAEKVARGPEEEFLLMPKYDGLSAESNPGLLVTRGDGEMGFDISDRIQYINDIPEATGVRGEIVVLKSDFLEKKPARSGGDLYKTERSAASGLVNNTNPIEKGILTFVPFERDAWKGTLDELKNNLNWEYYISQAQESNYPLDGMVLSLADRDYGRNLGLTGHHPRHSMALKFKNPSAITKVVGIRWTSGKHKLTPTAILEPVEISGFMNSRASLHNIDYLKDLDIMVGDTVEVERCGDIIPQVVRVVAKGKRTPGVIEVNCPDCGLGARYQAPDMVCDNSACPGKIAKNLHDAITRLGIENIGPATVEDLVAVGVTTISRLSSMTVVDWKNMPGFADVSASAAYNELDRVFVSPIEDYRVLAALNIQGVGLTISKKLLAEFTLAELLAMDKDSLSNIEGIGSIRAGLLFDGLASKELNQYLRLFNIVGTKGLHQARKKVCFTGKSDIKRDEWIKIADAKGYEFSKSVTKDLDLLVCDDVESNSSKAKKARGAGVKILTYEQFKEV